MEPWTLVGTGNVMVEKMTFVLPRDAENRSEKRDKKAKHRNKKENSFLGEGKPFISLTAGG